MIARKETTRLFKGARMKKFLNKKFLGHKARDVIIFALLFLIHPIIAVIFIGIITVRKTSKEIKDSFSKQQNEQIVKFSKNYVNPEVEYDDKGNEVDE